MHDWGVALQALLVFLWAGILLRGAYLFHQEKTVYKRAALVAFIPYLSFASHFKRWWLEREYVAVASLLLVTVAVIVISFQQWQYRNQAFE